MFLEFTNTLHEQLPSPILSTSPFLGQNRQNSNTNPLCKVGKIQS